MRQAFFGTMILTAFLAGAQLAGGQGGQVGIHILNGRNGNPIANNRILVFMGASGEEVREHRRQVELRTDEHGTATLAIADPETSRIQVWVDSYVLCQETPNNNSYPVDDIRRRGVQGPDNCGSTVLTAIPGELYVFVRPATLKEKMRR